MGFVAAFNKSIFYNQENRYCVFRLKTADAIVERFGERSLEVLEHKPERLLRDAFKLLNEDLDQPLTRNQVEQQLIAMINLNVVVSSNGNIYLPHVYKQECETALKVVQMTLQAPEPVNPEPVMEQVRERLGITLSQRKTEGVEMAFRYNLSIITGGPGTKVLLVGDADQLESVGAGNVFQELIESGMIPVTVLDQIFRQAQGSRIAYNAKFINEGSGELYYGPDFDFIPAADQKEAAETVRRLYKEEAAREEINPAMENKPEMAYGSRVFRLRDRVILVGQKKALFIAVSKTRKGKRNTLLAERMRLYHSKLTSQSPPAEETPMRKAS